MSAVALQERTTRASRERTAAPASVPRLERGAVLTIAGAFVALELAMSARYGIHRDELYFIQCAHHLAWGYVDQPPFTPFVAWVATHAFGVSAVSLRVIPALAGGGTVMLAALMARELGGTRVAQVIAALAAATAAEQLATFHLLSTSAFDSFFWALISFLALRVCRTGDPRLLLALGGATGVALMNKLNAGLFVLALVVSIAAGGHRRVLVSGHALAGAGIAAVLFLPDVLWNASHGWAQLSMLHSLHAENSGLGASLQFIPAQLIVVGPVLAFVWIPGLVRLWRDRAGLGRPFALSFVLLVAFFTITGGKTYYLAGAFYVLFAGGGVAIEHRLAAQPSVSGGLRRWTAVIVLGALPTLPLVLPVLPAATLPTGSWEGQINKDLSATYGWPQFVRQVAAVAGKLPRSERDRLVVFTGDYGAAGAVDLYGGAYHLPPAISGHNNFWWWGPGSAPNDSTTIAVNLPASYLRTIFSSVRLVGSVATPHNAWTEERGDPIYVCTGQLRTWAAAWPGARHYG